MINFRFHIISLVAVFLALALGIFLGAAVGEPTIVERLRGQINTAQERSNRLQSENSDLADEVDRLQQFVETASAFTVAGRLEGVDVAVIAERGVDDGPVDATVDLLRAAGANAPMVVWLQRRWELAEESDVEALADAIGSSSTTAEVVRSEAFNALARRVTRPRAESDATDPDDPDDLEDPDVLQALADANFIAIDGADLDALASFPATTARALVVDGWGGDIDDGELFASAVTTFKNRGVDTVAAEVGGDAPEETAQRGAFVEPVREDEALDGFVSTVDDLDLAQGRVSAVIALEQLAAGIVGDYGYGAGAARPVPEVLTP
jgi:hypothetical protein